VEVQGRLFFVLGVKYKGKIGIHILISIDKAK
jgi:hypothetical protein